VALPPPSATVLVTQECQTGVIGPSSPLRELADAAAPIVPNIARLAAAARSAGVPVVHCTFVRRPDGLGSNRNARLFRSMERIGMRLEPGSPEAAVLPEIGVDDRDIVLQRLHGVGPMGGTDLDAVCRNLGATAIVGVGVSVNVAIPSFALDAVNLGYEFVLPRDAVAGVPAAYADAVIDNTLSLLATVVSTDDVVAAWAGS
jgi:nicotinamidase-related amidase